MQWYYFYLPLHVAGSGGCTLIGKVQDTAENVRQAFGRCAHIEGQVVTFYKRVDA